MITLILWVVLVVLMFSGVALNIVYEKSNNEKTLKVLDKSIDLITVTLYLVSVLLVLLTFIGIGT